MIIAMIPQKKNNCIRCHGLLHEQIEIDYNVSSVQTSQIMWWFVGGGASHTLLHSGFMLVNRVPQQNGVLLV